jgi:two-component system, OmpR family, response regulator
MPTAETAKTILVVDDDPDFLAQQQMQLEAAHFKVLAAPGVPEARRVLEECQPDLAILDLMMEDADGGFALSYHLRKKYPKVPIILVTAVTSQTGLDFTPSGADQKSWVKADIILPKPVRFEQLKREIDRLLAR